MRKIKSLNNRIFVIDLLKKCFGNYWFLSSVRMSPMKQMKIENKIRRHFPGKKGIYLNKIVQRLIYHMMTYHFDIKVKSSRYGMHLYVSPTILCFLSKMFSKKLNWYIDMFEKHNDMLILHMNFSCLDRKMKYMNSNYNKTP